MYRNMYRQLFFDRKYFLAMVLYLNLSSVSFRSTGFVKLSCVYGRSFLDRSNANDMEGNKS